MSGQTCCVYMVAADQWVKVGIAKDVSRRILAIQTGNPHHVRLLKQWRSESRELALGWESFLHSLLHQWTTKGEWFSPPLEVVMEILGWDDMDELMELDEVLRVCGRGPYSASPPCPRPAALGAEARKAAE